MSLFLTAFEPTHGGLFGRSLVMLLYEGLALAPTNSAVTVGCRASLWWKMNGERLK